MLLKVDLITAFYGCLYVGVVPVTIRPPHPQNLQTTLPTVRMIVDVSKSAIILSSAQVIYFPSDWMQIFFPPFHRFIVCEADLYILMLSVRAYVSTQVL